MILFQLFKVFLNKFIYLYTYLLSLFYVNEYLACMYIYICALHVHLVPSEAKRAKCKKCGGGAN